MRQSSYQWISKHAPNLCDELTAFGTMHLALRYPGLGAASFSTVPHHLQLAHQLALQVYQEVHHLEYWICNH